MNRVFLIIILIIIFPLIAFSQNVLTVDDAVSLALKNNYDSYSDSLYKAETLVTENNLLQFQKSSEYYNLHLKYKKKAFLKSVFFLLLSISKSPITQFQYLYQRFILKIKK